MTAAGASARGAPVDQVLIVGAALTLMAAVLLTFALARDGGPLARRIPIQRWGSRTIKGMPAWSLVPALWSLCSIFFLYTNTGWDAALHIDSGRDDGPLSTSAHYGILLALTSTLAAGWVGMVGAGGRPGPAPIRIARGWHVPIGAMIIAGCGAYVLSGFVVDDVWHRLFGQDLGFWTPTHSLELSGGPLTSLGILTLLAEGRWSSRAAPSGAPPPARTPWLGTARAHAILGGSLLLMTTSTWAWEYEFGVPQWQLAYHPILIAIVASLTLVPIRILGGRGAALGAVGIYLAVRMAHVLFIGGVMDETEPRFALYLVEALLVEAVALRLATRRSFRFAAACAVAIGTVGVAVEWLWSRAAFAFEWPARQLPLALLAALIAALGAATLGAFLAAAIARRREVLDGRRPVALAATALIVVVATLAAFVPTDVPDATGRLTVTPAPAAGDGERWMDVTVRFSPASVADDADSVRGLAWQGGDRIRRTGMDRIAPGVYRTRRPLPASSPWKAWVWTHRGPSIGVVPVFLANDPAIPAPEVPAVTGAVRPMQSVKRVLQRERDAAPWAWAAGSAFVYAVLLALAIATALLMRRFALGRDPGEGRPPEAPRSGPVAVADRRPAGVA